jgi:signal peptidase I
MAPTILPGDFILADKITCGARIFTSLKFNPNDDPPMIHVPGFRSIRRNDVLVFNYPYCGTWDTVRMNLEKIFVKRCIGIAGDSVSAIGGFYHVCGLADTLGYIPEQKRFVRQRVMLDSVIMKAVAFDESFHWDIFDFGPFYVPAVGATITLTPNNTKLYHRQITYETGLSVLMNNSVVYIGGHPAHSYTFRHNWYFVAGDNVMNSQDSRYIGLIPQAYIIGKAAFVISSKDAYTEKRRWNRTMKKIK